jgi:N-methylhydantoinase A
VTDADLVLGYLDPDFFLGRRMRLDVEGARRAITETVAGPMGFDLPQAAWSIHRVVNENMAAAARIHGIERGKDLRAYPLFAFGGAGPVHAWHVGRILKVPRVLVPFGAGAASALGLLSAPLAFDFVRTATQRLDGADWAQVNRLFVEMEAEGRAVLREAGIAEADMRFRRTAEMRYAGQGHEVEGPVPAGVLGPASLEALTTGFEAAYRALYQRTPMGVAIEALNWRVVVSGPEPALTTISGGLEMAPALPPSADSRAATSGITSSGGPFNRGEATLPRSPLGATVDQSRPIPKRARKAYFPEAGGYVETPVYDRYGLQPGAAFAGPAIIEERESTTIIAPGARVRVDASRGLVAEPA